MIHTLAGAPNAIPQACVIPEIAVKEVPLFVEWNRPLSVETQTSPVTEGFTAMSKG